LGDSLAAGAAPAGTSSPALAAALAGGMSPAQALAQAAAAAQQLAVMTTAATVPIEAGASAATVMSGGQLPPSVGNQESFALALASGASPEAALARAATAAQTLTSMQATATLPPTEANQAATTIASGSPEALQSALGTAGGTAGQAAMLAVLQSGGNVDAAIAAAGVATATLADQEARGTVPMDAAAQREADLAQGKLPDGGGNGAVVAAQLADASVAAEPAALALAQGQVPVFDGDDEPDEVIARLLRALRGPDAMVRELAARAAAGARLLAMVAGGPPNARTDLLERLAQGRATAADLALLLRHADPVSDRRTMAWLSSPDMAGLALTRPPALTRDDGQTAPTPSSNGG
jgi:hypothetical protein